MLKRLNSLPRPFLIGSPTANNGCSPFFNVIALSSSCFINMRGPGLHISPDLRRKWRCPACSRERLVAQTETTVVCRCQDPPKFMQLVEGQRVVRPEPRPVPHFYAVSYTHLTLPTILRV